MDLFYVPLTTVHRFICPLHYRSIENLNYENFLLSGVLVGQIFCPLYGNGNFMKNSTFLTNKQSYHGIFVNSIFAIFHSCQLWNNNDFFKTDCCRHIEPIFALISSSKEASIPDTNNLFMLLVLVNNNETLVGVLFLNFRCKW